MIIASIDLETTGIDSETCDVIEFACVVDDLQNQKPIDELPVFHAYVLPKGDLYEKTESLQYNGDPRALSFHAKIFAKIADHLEGKNPAGLFLHPEEVGEALADFFNEYGISGKVTPAGKNFSSFDYGFIELLPDFTDFVGLERANFIPPSGVTLRKRVMDPAVLFFNVETDEALPDSKECCKRAKVPFTETHTAVDDAKAVIHMVREGIKRLNP